MDNQAAPSKAALWVGRVSTTVVVLFLVFDGLTKVVQESHVRAAMVDLGFPESLAVPIGTILLGCTLLYAIPRTAVLGSVLLTGYLGGAVVVQLRVAHPAFECAFPVIFGVLVWAGIFLREPRLRALLPSRTT